MTTRILPILQISNTTNNPIKNCFIGSIGKYWVITDRREVYG